MNSVFSRESFFSVPGKELFTFHERKDAFRLLTPSWANVDLLSTASTLEPTGEVVRFVARFLFFKFRFGMVHTVYEPYEMFVDEQKEGLFTGWRHRHMIRQAGWKEDPASSLHDRIEYSHPLLPFFNLFVRLRLRKLFRYRHDVTAKEVHMGENSMKVVVTGATGTIGKRVVEILQEKGAKVTALVRNPEKAAAKLGDGIEYAVWDAASPDEGNWRDPLCDSDGVIHLAGTPIFEKRWNSKVKKSIEESRVLGTRQLAEAIKNSERKPAVFISASAVGIYGTDPSILGREDAKPADEYLARLCVDWEAESDSLRDVGVRPVQVRIGVVLTPEAGALKSMVPPFKLGLGGTLGYPDRYVNWIHLEDIARIFIMALSNEKMDGPYNGVAPNPVTNAQFCRAVARALRRPALFRIPTPILKLMLGEIAEYASGGAQASADRVRSAGYDFFFEEIPAALENLLR